MSRIDDVAEPTRSATTTARSRFGALTLAGSGVAFLLYPTVRPYSDETTLAGADAMASTAWVVAHLCAIAGFVLLGLGIFELYRVLGDQLSWRAVVLVWIGVGFQLPFYGGETFALNVIGARAVRDQDVSLLELAEDFRFGAASMFSGIGLLVGIGVVVAAVAVARSGVLPRWSAVPLAVGMVLFLPVLWGPPALRMAHGVLVAIGAAYLAVAVWRGRESIHEGGAE